MISNNDFDTMCIRSTEKVYKKPVNYERVKWVTQEEKENPTFFNRQVVEALRKYTNIDPFTREDQSLLGPFYQALWPWY